MEMPGYFSKKASHLSRSPERTIRENIIAGSFRGAAIPALLAAVLICSGQAAGSQLTAGSSGTGIGTVPADIASAPASTTEPDSTDRALMRIVEAVIEGASYEGEPWPGYDAAERPLMVYREGKWCLLLNPPSYAPPKGWIKYPETWPVLSCSAWLDPGGDNRLVGQLDFDHEVAGKLVVAVPLYEEIPAKFGKAAPFLYSFIAHEAFHQFQRHSFSDVNTPSDERYPMLDPENNAMAAMELRSLEEAFEAICRSDSIAAREDALTALAVHNHRWERLDGDAREIERSLEIVEGTAKYVETRAMAAFADYCGSAGTPSGQRGLCGQFEGIDAAGWLSRDFENRFTGGALAPTDMARNRLYPSAAALAFLLDAFEPTWKSTVEAEGTSRSLFDHLEEALGEEPSARPALVDKAKEKYHWDELLSASSVLVREYRARFDSSLTSFESQRGTRIVLKVPSDGLVRSRSSRGERLVEDAGRRILGRFITYALRRQSDPSMEFSVKDAFVLDENKGGGFRAVTFFTEDPVKIAVDGSDISTSPGYSRTFHEMTLESGGARLHSELGGMLTVRPGTVSVEMDIKGD